MASLYHINVLVPGEFAIFACNLSVTIFDGQSVERGRQRMDRILFVLRWRPKPWRCDREQKQDCQISRDKRGSGGSMYAEANRSIWVIYNKDKYFGEVVAVLMPCKKYMLIMTK